jgi:potassium efflux system protein
VDTVDKLLAWPLFSIGDTQTTVGIALSAIGVVFATLLLGQLVQRAIQGFFENLHVKDHDAAKGYGIIVQVVIWIVGFELALHLLGIRLTTLFAASGFFALGAGFAVKNIVENFLSGAILRVEKTIQPGDVIVVNDKWLFIKRIGMRTTAALTYDGEEVLIPNSLVAQSVVTNLTREDRLHRIHVVVGVAFSSDLDLVRKTLEETVDQLEWRSQAKPPKVYLEKFGDSRVEYVVNVWIDDAGDSLARRSDLHEVIWRALRKQGISIAFRQLDVHVDRVDAGQVENRE